MSESKEKVTIVNGKRRRRRVDVYAVGPNNTVLAFCRANRYPFTPGGGVDEGEDDVTAGLREMAEETGWIGKNAYVYPMRAFRFFSGPDKGWFNKAGWDEEENIAVVCDAVEFAPKDNYENNGMLFKLCPIEQVYNETSRALERYMCPREANLAQFRMVMLKELMHLHDDDLKRPSWLKW